jgi:multidrug resistance efflux pump
MDTGAARLGVRLRWPLPRLPFGRFGRRARMGVTDDAIMMENSPPALRGDLRLSRREAQDGLRFVVKVPDTRRFYQFREAEYAIIRRLDGVRSAEAIAREASLELAAELEAADVEEFVDQLRRSGLLEGAAEARRRQPWVQGTPLWIRFKAFDPDALLERWIGRLRFFFTPHFVALSAATILLALVLTVIQHDAILRDMARLWRIENLVLAWVTVLVVTAGHEFAHGFTCKRFGGEVREMGFLLIYFQPALYCNISDAWLFPKRSHRLWVTFAGAYFELVVWAVATLSWRLLEPGTWVSLAALVVMATSGIKLFFNLNPLIKLDGYYLLSDLLDVPNLRPRAFAFINRGVKRLFGFPVGDPDLLPTPRERRIFLAYGLMAMTFSYWFLTQIALGFGSYLTWRYQGWGFAMASGLVTAMFWTPIRGLLPRGGAVPLAQVTNGPAGAGPVENEAAPSARRLWRSPKLELLALTAATFVLLFLLPREVKVSGEFTVLPLHNAEVRAQVEGIIERVYVLEGERVRAGDTILLLDEREYRADLAGVEAEIEERQSRLRLLRAGPRMQEIELAQLVVVRARERVTYSQNELERAVALEARGALSQVEFEKVAEEAGIRARELQEAEASLELLRAGARVEELEAVEQDVARLEAERGRVREQLGNIALLAPHDGVIVTPKIHEKVGSFVEPGDLVAEVHDLSVVQAEIDVPERVIGDVRIGQEAELRLRAYPERTFRGRVAAIAPAATGDNLGYERTVRVDIVIENSDGLLRPGLSGYARISAGESRMLDVLTRRLRRYLRVEFWSWWEAEKITLL